MGVGHAGRLLDCTSKPGSAYKSSNACGTLHAGLVSGFPVFKHVGGDNSCGLGFGRLAAALMSTYPLSAQSQPRWWR